MVNQNISEDNEIKLFIAYVETEFCPTNKKVDSIYYDWNIKLKTNGINIMYKIDPGAQVNLLSINEVNKFNPKPELLKTNVRLNEWFRYQRDG